MTKKQEAEILNFTMDGIEIDGSMITDEANSLAAAYAADVKQGSPADKIALLVRAITGRCIFCFCEAQIVWHELMRTKTENYDPVVWLEKIADCPRSECPIHVFGPSVIQALRARMDSEDPSPRSSRLQ